MSMYRFLFLDDFCKFRNGFTQHRMNGLLADASSKICIIADLGLLVWGRLPVFAKERGGKGGVEGGVRKREGDEGETDS